MNTAIYLPWVFLPTSGNVVRQVSCLPSRVCAVPMRYHPAEICLGNQHTSQRPHPKSASENTRGSLPFPLVSLRPCRGKHPLRKKETPLRPLSQRSQAIIHNMICMEIIFQLPSAKNTSTHDGWPQNGLCTSLPLVRIFLSSCPRSAPACLITL